MPRVEVSQMPGIELLNETTRRNMAYGSLFGFLGLHATIILVGWLWARLPIDDVLKVLTTTAGVLSGVVGAVVGFYFRGVDK
jgi:hypothetical protein